MKRCIQIIIYCITACMTLMIALYIIAYFSGNPESKKDRYVNIYDCQSQLIYSSTKQYSNHYVTLKDISPYFTKAIVAIEDKRFYQHHGFDYISILRAIKTNITASYSKQGASTITQQYARLLYLTNEKTWSRKIREAFFTLRLETHLSKNDILEGYCNSVYFGHGIYGIENAAHYYYAKDAKDLSLNEASLLAGVVNGPSYYSPILHPQASKKRQALVIDSMYKCHFIKKDQVERIKQESLQLSSHHTVDNVSSNQYYQEAVIDELDALGYYNNKYLNKGLHVYTALDQSIQKQITQYIKDSSVDSSLQTAFALTRPRTSQLIALIGGRDYLQSQYNRAIKAKRQIGSTIKPFLYYLALNNGFNPTTQFLCEPTTFKLEDGSTYSPSNYGHRYAYKNITLAQAIAVSDNIYAMKTHLFLGEETLASLLKSFGFKKVTANASLALGTFNTNIYQLANMYTSLAHLGQYQPIYTITKITDKQGHTLYHHQDHFKQKLNRDTCLILNKLLTGSSNKIFNTYLNATMSSYSLQYPLACKTGSTDYDNLCVAYNPDILIAGWSGFDDNRKIEKGEEKTFVKDITVKLLDDLNRKETFSWYKKSKTVSEIKINPLTGENDENGIAYWFKESD